MGAGGRTVLSRFKRRTKSQSRGQELSAFLCFRPKFLVKWKGFELDPDEWTEYGLLEEAEALEVWERAHPPPQGIGNPPPPPPSGEA